MRSFLKRALPKRLVIIVIEYLHLFAMKFDNAVNSFIQSKFLFVTSIFNHKYFSVLSALMSMQNNTNDNMVSQSCRDRNKLYLC